MSRFNTSEELRKKVEFIKEELRELENYKYELESKRDLIIQQLANKGIVVSKHIDGPKFKKIAYKIQITDNKVGLDPIRMKYAQDLLNNNVTVTKTAALVKCSTRTIHNHIRKGNLIKAKK